MVPGTRRMLAANQKHAPDRIEDNAIGRQSWGSR
jgi:hypothetical protein